MASYNAVTRRQFVLQLSQPVQGYSWWYQTAASPRHFRQPPLKSGLWSEDLSLRPSNGTQKAPTARLSQTEANGLGGDAGDRRAVFCYDTLYHNAPGVELDTMWKTLIDKEALCHSLIRAFLSFRGSRTMAFLRVAFCGLGIDDILHVTPHFQNCPFRQVLLCLRPADL